MTTATPETEVQPATYVMPKIGVGQRVLFYSQGTKETGRLPSMAFVKKVHGRSIVLQTFDGSAFTSAPHVSDPRLKDNPDLRQEGAWDYTDDDLKFQAFMDDMTDRMAKLERQVNGLIAKKQ